MSHKIEEYIVINEVSEDLEYKISKQDNTLLLRYSLSSVWVKVLRGGPIVKLKNTGNEVKIEFVNSKKKINLDYSEFIELLLIMELSHSLQTEPNRYQIIEVEDER